jgi:hypothetical protein
MSLNNESNHIDVSGIKIKIENGQDEIVLVQSCSSGDEEVKKESFVSNQSWYKKKASPRGMN